MAGDSSATATFVGKRRSLSESSPGEGSKLNNVLDIDFTYSTRSDQPLTKLYEMSLPKIQSSHGLVNPAFDEVVLQHG